MNSSNNKFCFVKFMADPDNSSNCPRCSKYLSNLFIITKLRLTVATNFNQVKARQHSGTK